jgi:hypothetical protein
MSLQISNLEKVAGFFTNDYETIKKNIYDFEYQCTLHESNIRSRIMARRTEP